MATFYRCDRCRKEEREALEKIEVPAPENRNDYKGDRRIDLCRDCLIKLNQFVDPLPLIGEHN